MKKLFALLLFVTISQPAAALDCETFMDFATTPAKKTLTGNIDDLSMMMFGFIAANNIHEVAAGRDTNDISHLQLIKKTYKLCKERPEINSFVHAYGAFVDSRVLVKVGGE